MKLSFSLPSKSKPKLTTTSTSTSNDNNTTNSVEFVTEFDPSKTLTPSIPKHVIPPIPNTWRPHKKMKNLDLPTGPTNLEFEPEILSNESKSDNTTYGLKLRVKPESNGTSEERRVAPLEQIMLQSLKRDLESLADDPTLEDFESVPVEGFGAALMVGYGWIPGKGIGKNAKEDVVIKEYKKWSAKEGLGFDLDKSKAVVKDNNINNLDKSKAVIKDNKNIGKEVRIVGGRDVGLKGKIVEKLGSEFYVVKVDGREEEVRVGVGEVADLGSVEEERCLRKLKGLELDGNAKDKKASKRGAERGVRSEGRVSEKSERKERRVKPSWLRSHIKVRVVSKELKGGRLYLKKGRVVDVVGPTTCDITMDETQELVQGVDQELLETALPRRGGPVLVLLGKHKGVYGNLVEKDLDKETGVVRDLDNHKMLDVRLEQVAEYMGDMEDVEY